MAVVVIRKKGSSPIKFRAGGLHRTTSTPPGRKIPSSKVRAAAAGKYGPLGVKQANLATGALKRGRETAARHR